MPQTVKLKFEGQYSNHNVKANKAVSLVFKMPYTELSNYVQSLQMLNENVIFAIKLSADKPKKIGSFMIKNLNIGGDGAGTLKLDSMLDYVEPGILNELATRSDEPLFIMLKATIEDDEEPEEDEDEIGEEFDEEDEDAELDDEEDEEEDE
jgi:hypothetical protein